MPLPDVIEEALQWHQLYPDAGCTPAIVTLRALDPVAASRVAAAFVDKRLPLQQQERCSPSHPNPHLNPRPHPQSTPQPSP
eukprot:7246063-Prymnesium_polylepis.1